jgi:hypothetical protein
MSGLHQTDGIEAGLGEESVEEELSFGWFMYMKGGMLRKNMHEHSWANRVLAGCLRKRRQGEVHQRHL